MTTTETTQGIPVRIFGDEYRIASELNAEDLRRIAAYVDKKMEEAAAHSGRHNKTHLAVLAAMEIAVELFRSQQEKGQLIQKACENIDLLRHLVEDRSALVSLTSEWTDRQSRLALVKRCPPLRMEKIF